MKNFQFALQAIPPYFFSCVLAVCYCRRNYSKLPCSNSCSGVVLVLVKDFIYDTYRDYAFLESLVGLAIGCYWLYLQLYGL